MLSSKQLLNITLIQLRLFISNPIQTCEVSHIILHEYNIYQTLSQNDEKLYKR